MLKELIASRLKDMTPGQTAVAAFILDNTRDAAFLTASQIGKRAGVSEATVIRLSMLLGFSGYHDFRDALRNHLMDHLSTLERIREYDSPKESGIFERAVKKDLETLSEALASLVPKNLTSLGKALAGAEAVYLAASRSSTSLSGYLSFYLSWMLPNVRAISADIPFETLMNAPRGSLVVGISFPRYSTWTVNVMDTASRLGIDTAAVTNHISSPLAAKAKYIVTIPYKPVSFIDSFAAPMSVLNCIILSVAQVLGSEMKEKLELLERNWKEEEMYVQGRNRQKEG